MLSTILMITVILVVAAWAIFMLSMMATPNPAWSKQSGMDIWTDPATGCRYVEANGETQVLTALVRPDGKPDCEVKP